MNKKKKKRGPGILVIFILLAIILGVLWWIISTHTVKNVYVEGNVHYSSEEIKQMVMNGPMGNNSLYLSLKYHEKGVKNVPFVDVMDVEVLEPDTIKIIVYEKSLAGYMEFMDSFVYFDKDGYMVETSTVRTAGIPQVAGLKFQSVTMGEKIPVENERVFETIMSIANLLKKYELNADKIFFQSDYDIILYFGELRVALGDDSGLEDKVMQLSNMLEQLAGKKGVLHMENYLENRDMTIFEVDKTDEVEEIN